MRLLLAALLIAGCAPSPPGGGYRCGTGGACPSSQHCTCGLCVYDDGEAACGFAIDVPPNANVAEHQKFPITVRALQVNGVVAGGFGGEVSLSSTWGDVRPDKVTLNNGSATVMVSLNRETVKPQSAVIKATFADSKGSSSKVFVSLPPFTRDPTPVVPPATLISPFGWADLIAAQPDVIKTSTGYRMYFIGVGPASQNKPAVGTATSTDGKTFAPASQPVFTPTAQIEPLIGTAAFTGPFGPSMVVGVGAGSGVGKGFSGGIAVATSSDASMPFKLGNNGKPVLTTMNCQYCKSAIGFPSIIADPLATNSDGSVGGWFMFFSALEEVPSSFPVVSIGRASSTDGVNFVPEAAPLLEGAFLGKEVVMLSPHVLVDGTVLKMWYTFTSSDSRLAPDFCGVDPRDKVEVGYATASYANPSDGLFWVRSQSNPVLTIGGGGWDMDNRAILVGSVLPLDGTDPSSGVQLYYSTYRKQGFTADTCVPDGMGRATRM